MALEDDDVKRIADELVERQKGESKSNPFKSMTPTTKLLLGAGVLIVVWLLFSENMTQIQKGGLLVIGVGAIIWLTSFGETQRKMLTDRELVTIAYDLLKWKQSHHLGGHYQIPQGEIRIDSESVPETVDGQIMFWRRRVWIVPTNKVEIEYEMRQDPFDGDLRGFIERPEGFYGKDILPRERIFSKGALDEFSYERERKKRVG